MPFELGDQGEGYLANLGPSHCLLKYNTDNHHDLPDVLFPSYSRFFVLRDSSRVQLQTHLAVPNPHLAELCSHIPLFPGLCYPRL